MRQVYNSVEVDDVERFAFVCVRVIASAQSSLRQGSTETETETERRLRSSFAPIKTNELAHTEHKLTFVVARHTKLTH